MILGTMNTFDMGYDLYSNIKPSNAFNLYLV